MPSPFATITANKIAVARPEVCRAPRGGLVVAGHAYPAGSILPASAGPALAKAATLAARHAAVEPLVIGIRGHDYEVRSVPAPVGTVPGAFEVTPLGKVGESYRVTVSPRGEVRCNCPDFRIRRAGTGLRCKHGSCLVELGLVVPHVAEGGRS